VLERILPAKGYKCVCIFWHPDKAPKQKFYLDLEDAEEFIAKKDAKGDTVYIAQATYTTPDNRKHENVQAMRSFWLDIDCGPTKPFATQADGAAALKKFCEEVGLPIPEVVNSGNGLYAHWCLTEDVTASQWKGAARLFKELIVACEFEVDQSRTSDLSSVLRPIGTHNRKDPANPKLVRLLTKPMEPISFEDFCTIIEKAAKAKNLKADLTAPPKRKGGDINAEFQIYDDTPNSDATLIADKCQQIDIMRKTQGDIEEPLWYACIGVLRHTVQAPDIIHEWSCGHPNYSIEETTAKIEQHQMPPTTCEHFGQLNPKGCLGCSYKNKVKSPILLGRIVQAIEHAAGIEPPKPFIRAEDGLYAPIDDVNTCFYRNDLYVDSVAFDQSLGYEVVAIRHHLPQEGWMDCTIRTSDLTDVRSAMKALFDKHITVVGAKEKKLMTAYVESYADKLKRERKIKQLLCQMGWSENDRGELQFVLGTKAFLPDGTAEPVALAQNIPESAKAFHAKGELPQWLDTTTVLGKEGMEPLAFAFLAAAFGAPLMRFTGYAGAIVSMLGPSGVGKTLVGRWALSLYGEPDTLIMHKDDTKNALIGRLGVYNTLPLYIDEVTNIDGDALSELAYRITQGRDRVRQNSNAVEKSGINQWNTLALVSSNSSLIDRLSGHKMDAGAEMNRVFEFRVDSNPALDRETATRIYRTISRNYGMAGQEYIRYLVANVANHTEQIDKIVKMIDKETGAASEERFWSAVAGCTIYGGLIAQRLGLIDFKVKPLMGWAVDQIKEMRGEKVVNRMDCVSIIGQFLDEHINNTLVVRRGTVISEPKGPLFVRRDVESPLVWINRNRVKEWAEKKYGSYSTIKNDLFKIKALVSTEKRRTLGAGTSLASAQVNCWVLDMDCPALGNVAARIVEDDAKRVAKLALVEELDVKDAGLTH